MTTATTDDRWLPELQRLAEAHPDRPVVHRMAGRYVLVGADGCTLRGDGGVELVYATPEGAVAALRAAVERRRDALVKEARAMLPAWQDAAMNDPIVDRFADICQAWADCKAALADVEPASEPVDSMPAFDDPAAPDHLADTLAEVSR